MFQLSDTTIVKVEPLLCNQVIWLLFSIACVYANFARIDPDFYFLYELNHHVNKSDKNLFLWVAYGFSFIKRFDFLNAKLSGFRK